MRFAPAFAILLLTGLLGGVPVAAAAPAGLSLRDADSSALALMTLSQTAFATVVRVVDGDTVDVRLDNGSVERIRLIGLDTPETVDPRQAVQCFGIEASQRAHELLDGQVVGLEGDASQGERDRYTRRLAYLWLPDGRNFAETMIADGFGHEYTYRLPYTYQAQFRAAQTSAQVQSSGLWASGTCAGRPGLADLDDDLAPMVETAGPGPALVSLASSAYDPRGPDRDCGDFRTQAEAQAFFSAAGGPRADPHRLDADHDGVVCETLH